MEKRYYYLIALISFFLSLLVDQDVASFLAQYRTASLNVIFNFFTLIGTFIVIPLILISIYLWKTKNKRLIIQLWLSLFLSLAIAYLLKFTVQKPRPEQALGIKAVISENGYSFPSAHATAAFSALPILDFVFKKSRFLWHTLAILVAFSRVYLGVHYLSDIIAGALIGYIVSDFVASKYCSKIIKKINFLSR